MSKIPEEILQAGCTAYSNIFLNANGSFGEGIEAAYFAIHDHHDWVSAGPEEWKGEGKPPFGTICEYTDVHGLKWYGCEIIAYHGDHVWLRTTAAKRDHVKVFGAFRFRPIRAPEQIAAEEREKAIDQMLADAQRPGNHMMSRFHAEDLYKAGYRKFEIVEGE